MKNLRLIGIIVLLVTASQVLGADWCDVEILPPDPTSSDVVTITLSGQWGDSCVPNASAIYVVGNYIYFDVILDYPAGVVCAYVVLPWELSEYAGPLSEGTYTVYGRIYGDAYDWLTDFVVEDHQTRYVPSQYSTIQAAIDDCNDGDTVIVAPGTYFGPGNYDIDFSGKAITVKSQNGPETCIIDAFWHGRGFLFHSGEDEDSIVEGFTITHGQLYCAPGDPCPISWYGGGIYCDYSESPTIKNCIITDNFAHFGGGVHGGGPTIINCVFTDNEALNGSAIYAYGDTQIINCTIARNTAGLYGAEPAVILLNGGMVLNSILWDNYPDQLMVLGANTISYSDIEGGWPGTGNIDADPCFVDADANDFHLIGGISPCFNTGDPNYVPGPNETDIDGDERVIDGRVDMGADEVSDCMAVTNPTYDNWVYWSKPDCWCYARQCRGDADGLKFANIFWVSGMDLTLLKGTINKLEASMPEGGECADFDHQKFANTLWVSGNDLAILRQYTGKLEAQIPLCGNPPDPNYNFWVSP